MPQKLVNFRTLFLSCTAVVLRAPEMASTSSQTAYDAHAHWGNQARNFHTSARLHLQHLLFQNTLGGLLLEPRVEQSLSLTRALTVADIGCGNGVWLSDLDHVLSGSNNKASFQLHGFDINTKGFPAPPFLSKRIKLWNLDVLATPLTAELRGAFDVVHIRAFVSIIRNHDLGPLLGAVRELLKPGGWLQWEETRADNFVATSPSSDVSKEACESIIRIMEAGGKASGFDFSWLGSLDEHIARHGFDKVQLRH